jgi:hypothetical protein
MEFNMAWGLFEALEREIEALEADNYGQYTLTVVIKNDINGLAQNCGIRIYAIHNDPIISPLTITLDYLGIVETDELEN